MTKIFAHRGASSIAPENTLEAFELAVAMGSEGIELDVLPTADGNVVVIHDETIDKTSNGGKGFVWQKNLEELKSYDFSFDKIEYKGAKIPTLGETLDLLRNTDVVINIEIKDSSHTIFRGFNKKLVEIQKAFGYEHERIIYSSFNHMRLKEFAKLDPTANLAILYGKNMISPWRYIKQIPCDSIHPPFPVLMEEGFVEKCKEHNCKLRTWTVDDKSLIKKILEKDIDAIITNSPDKAIKIREEFMA